MWSPLFMPEHIGSRIIDTYNRAKAESETDSVEGGGVRSEGVRVRILAFCVS